MNSRFRGPKRPPSSRTSPSEPTVIALPNTSCQDEIDEPAILKFPSIWTPPRAQDMESCARPIKRKPKPLADQQTLWPSRMDPDVLAYAELTREELAATAVPEDQRPWIRQNLSLREVYQDWILPDLSRRAEAKTLSRATLDKDRQSLARWEQFTRPSHWPEGKTWPGLPVGYITPKVVEQFLAEMFRKVPHGTASSTWSHVRNILNQAVRVRAIEVFPKPAVVPMSQPESVEYFSDQQIEIAYRALGAEIDLQVAFVVALAIGARCADIFLLRWDKAELSGPRPSIEFTAKKTGKRQRIPLAPVTVKQLLRLPSRSSSEFLFPGRSTPEAEDPEKCRPARRRRALINALLAKAGIVFEKPFQACRATCNKRLEDWRTGVGQFVLGHALTLNARHYYEPSDLIYEGVCSVPVPACFHEVG